MAEINFNITREAQGKGEIKNPIYLAKELADVMINNTENPADIQVNPAKEGVKAKGRVNYNAQVGLPKTFSLFGLSQSVNRNKMVDLKDEVQGMLPEGVAAIQGLRQEGPLQFLRENGAARFSHADYATFYSLNKGFEFDDIQAFTEDFFEVIRDFIKHPVDAELDTPMNAWFNSSEAAIARKEFAEESYKAMSDLEIRPVTITTYIVDPITDSEIEDYNAEAIDLLERLLELPQGENWVKSNTLYIPQDTGYKNNYADLGIDGY